MNMFLKMGFRNLFRNKRRSLLTSMIIGLGLAAMIITDGFIKGMSVNMVRLITQSLITEGQIHHPDFRSSFKVEDEIQNLPKVREILDHETQVRAYTERVISFAMVSSPKGMKNVTLYGITPQKESLVSDIAKQIKEGSFVEDEDSLVIGALLQNRLQIRIGEKVVVTVAKIATGEISQELFRVSGIIKAGSKEIDEKTAFIDIKRAQKMLGIGSSIHEIGIKFKEQSIGEKTSFSLWKQLKDTGNAAESWLEIASSFVNLMVMVDESKAIVAFALMFLVALGIINTLFMALYERMFEFAVLRALGTKSYEIILLILSEAGSLAILSVLAGFVITVVFALPMYFWGVDYSGAEFAEVTFREPVYYMFAWNQYTWFPLITLLFTIVVGLYPAVHAARIQMAQALKRSM